MEKRLVEDVQASKKSKANPMPESQAQPMPDVEMADHSKVAASTAPSSANDSTKRKVAQPSSGPVAAGSSGAIHSKAVTSGDGASEPTPVAVRCHRVNSS